MSRPAALLATGGAQRCKVTAMTGSVPAVSHQFCLFNYIDRLDKSEPLMLLVVSPLIPSVVWSSCLHLLLPLLAELLISVSLSKHQALSTIRPTLIGSDC